MPHLVAIAGGSGAGKSMLAEALRDEVGAESVAVVTMDSYFKDRVGLPLFIRERLNYDRPKSLDIALLASHLELLLSSCAVRTPEYDMSKHRRAATTRMVQSADVVVLDGHLALAAARLRALYRLSVFVQTPDDERLRRKLIRDVSLRGRNEGSVRHAWTSSVLPMHYRHVQPSARFADVVVDGTAPAARSAKAISELLQELAD